ncbi:hypothetical protein [Fimbriiglobus ruber]|uniref:Carboxypeptidase regulatory-like domain-containing protein n=1 Tax=Fimbriiglobus ruber TaxID=1908690 RepID=A0A225DR77_9BACT|nr:hypothetical protein [Fimbriiglobus ruber]OWK43801.1 hypothetical protein FRUB_03400 [Fimbriiglobus ruber]
MICPTRLLTITGLMAVLAVAGGCSSDPPARSVKGAVTLDGKPLAEGEISFSSDDPNIPPGVGPVANGAFDLSVKPGPKKVRVYARKAVPNTNPPMYNETLPDRYNANTELTAEVKSSGDNTCTFDLKSR